MRQPFAFILLLFALFCAALPAVGQKFQPKSIQFKGDPEYSDQEMLTASGLKLGAILGYSDMNDYSKRLMDTGAFESIAFKFDGQDLIFLLKPAGTLYPIRLENLPLTPGDELDAKLRGRFPLYHGKVPAEGTLLNDVRGALEEMVAAQGIKADVTATPFAAPGQHNATAMSFGIASPPVRVGAIHLEGVSASMQSAIKRVADRTSKTSFDSETSQRNIEHAFESFYADEGYARVKVKASRSGDPVETAEAIDIPYAVTIEEGHIYKLGSIHLMQDALVTQQEMDKATAPGGNGQVRRPVLQFIWFQISSRYKSKGYLDCTITPHPDFDEASGIVNYNVDVNAGSVYHLAFVKFDNVSDELRSKLMRVWQMMPGDPFDETYVSRFVVEAEKADPVLQRTLTGVKVTYDVHADPQTHEVNCVIHFAKAPQP